jgi:3-dehydroquinate dehydratase/shikimate dehydrogenase
MSTLVCVPITVRDPEQAVADAVRARDAGADIIEYRIDEFFTGEDESREYETAQILAMVSGSPLPSIVTCRVASEGGAYEGSEESRAGLYERLASPEAGEHPPRYIDCEHASFVSSDALRAAIGRATALTSTDGASAGLVLSMHDFQTRPADLTRRLLAMQGQEAASVVKVAYRARSLRDCLELLDLPAHVGKPTIALGMGEFGLMSRVLAPKFGGFLTFAALRSASATAPGQPTVKELLDLYRFRSIRRSTAVYGVIGWPVGHSLSPLVHNAGFEEVGHDGVYLPLPIAAGEGKDTPGAYESFKGTLLELIEHPRLNFRGASVTIPHKEHLARLAMESDWEIDELSKFVGAANTLIIERGATGGMSRCRVANTDAPAALDCVAEAVGDVRGKVVAIAGAGGVAKGIAAALAGAGAMLRIANRDLSRARALADAVNGRFGAGAAEWLSPAQLTEHAVDVFINCTPVGMKGGPDPTGLGVEIGALAARSPALTVMDTVYNPVRTPLVVEAERAGLRTIDGVGMFVRQASMQFSAWTGKPAPRAKFEALVRTALAQSEAGGATGGEGGGEG